MSTKQILARVFIALLLGTLTSCARPADRSTDTPADILEVRIVPGDQVEANQEVITEIMPVLEAFFWGAVEERRALVQYLSTACTTADGLGGPPKCSAGEAQGTLVQAFPVGEAEGHFVRPAEIERTLEFTVDALYAVYRPTPGRDPIEYWPLGEYALLFEREIYNSSQPVTAFVQDGKLVRLGFSPYPVDPAQLLSAISLDHILIAPEEARALTAQVTSPR